MVQKTVSLSVFKLGQGSAVTARHTIVYVHYICHSVLQPIGLQMRFCGLRCLQLMLLQALSYMYDPQTMQPLELQLLKV